MQIGKEMAIPSILKIGNGTLGKIGGYFEGRRIWTRSCYFRQRTVDMFGELDDEFPEGRLR